MNRARNNFFSSAGFTGDQDGSGRRRGELDDADDIAHRFRFADETSEPSRIAKLACERGDLFAIASAAEGTFKKRTEDGRLQRLFDVPERSGLDGGDSAFVAPTARDNDGGNILKFISKASKKFETIHAGKFDICDEERWFKIRELAESVFATRDTKNDVSPFSKECFVTRAGILFVFNDQDARGVGIFFGHGRDPILFGNLAAAGRQSKAQLLGDRENLCEMKIPNWTAFNMCTSEIENIAYARRTEYNLAVLRGGIVSLLPPVNTSGDRGIAGVVDLN